MSDQGFREIQLSSKQLVFLFMMSVVVAVGIFLLGVSVGRGVPSLAGGMEGVQTAELVPPADLPPPTEVAPGDRTYHDTLQGTPTPPAETVTAPAPTSAPPAAAIDDVDVVDEPVPPAPSTPEVQTPPPPPSAPAPQPTPPPAQSPTAKPAPPATATGQWLVQVGAFRARENAERQSQQLKTKGYAATVAPLAGGLYRVRVGPFAERGEADRVAQRLTREEGLKPSVTR